MPAPHEEWQLKPDESKRKSLIYQATQDMEKIMEKKQVDRALRHTTPGSLNDLYKPGYLVLIWHYNLIFNRIW